MLAMWVPELPFQLACQREGDLRARPLAFRSPQGGRVHTLWLVNRQARAEGLRAGDPMDLALRQVPGLRVLEPQPQTWWEAQASLGEFLQHWSPQGQLGRMGEALVELRGLERVHGSALDAADRLRRDLEHSHGWACHGGLSLSAAAAQIAARIEQRLEVVGEGWESAFLAPQPLPRLPDLQPRLHLRLRRLGLRRIGDLQPVPVPTLAQLVNEDEARKLLQRARGEDRPQLPLLAEPPHRSRHLHRLEPPCLPEAVPLRRWVLQQLWREARSPRRLELRWWDVDGLAHAWRAPDALLLEPPLALAPAVEAAFRARSERRALVHRLELRLTWGLGQAAGLFQDERSLKLARLEGALAKLRRRWPDRAVGPLWAAEAAEGYRAGP